MTTKKLIELYGQRVTPTVKLFGFIAILIFGVLIAFKGKSSAQAKEINTNVSIQWKTNSVAVATERWIKRINRNVKF